jgi:YD repeat-containing protein
LNQEERNGNAITYDRDGSGKLLSVGEPGGRRLTFSYNGSLISQVTDPIGRTVQYGYDSSSRLISVTDPSGRITQCGYHTDGVRSI